MLNLEHKIDKLDVKLDLLLEAKIKIVSMERHQLENETKL